MLTLAIDTSGLNGSLVLCRGDECVAEWSLQLGRQHGQSLIPAIETLLREHNLTARQLELIGVSIGPGSFTGLRVGIVCAKTLAYATGCKLVGVPTFDVIAHQLPPDVTAAMVIADAQRGDLFIGHYTRDLADPGRWQSPGPIEILSRTTWLERLSAADTVTGPAADVGTEDIAGRCRVVAPALRHPQALGVARLAQRSLAAGQTSDPWSLEPLYLRRSSAEDKWDVLLAAKAKKAATVG